MSNEFNAKNGLIIQYTQPVSGISNTTIINDDNSLVTEGQIYRELTGKTSNDIFTAYTASTYSEITGITHSTFSLNNQNMIANTTINDGDLATNLGIVDIPTSMVKVLVNGVDYNIGPGLDCFFKEPTPPYTVRNTGDEIQGDKLYWNGSVAGFQLDSGDTIDFVYMINGTQYSGGTVYNIPETRITGTTSSNLPTLSIDPTYRRIYHTITGGSGDTTISLANYSIINNRTLVIVRNTRGSDVKIVFPTANITNGGITYTFDKTVNDVTAKNGYSCEFELLFDIINQTNINIRISAIAFDYKSS